MKVFSTRSPVAANALASLNRRYSVSSSLQTEIANILSMVRTAGDPALLEFIRRFDGIALTSDQLRVTQEELSGIPNIDIALLDARSSIADSASRELRQDWQSVTKKGLEVGEQFQPLRRVGIHLSADDDPVVSNVLMTATLAKAAGCPEIVVCTPCGPDGRLKVELLAALKGCGVTEIYRFGGPHAIAAMAYGTDTIRPVDKIFGSGNRSVTEAKRQVFGAVAVDLLSGPSEIMVLCDETAIRTSIAADFVAQVEQVRDGQMVLLTTSARLIEEVCKQLELQSSHLPDASITRGACDGNIFLIEIADIEEGIRICNDYAPGRLSLVVEDDRSVMPKITTAGTILVGAYPPVLLGDLITGISNTLPTGGSGKSFSGLTIDQFQRRTRIVRFDREDIQQAPSNT